MEMIGVFVGILGLCVGVFSLAYQLGKEKHDEYDHYDKTQK